MTLTLYVTGKNPAAERALDGLRKFCEQNTHSSVDVSIIDVLERPQAAEDNHVLATPTLVKEFPPPARRVIGDLADLDRVAHYLGLAIDVLEGTEKRK